LGTSLDTNQYLVQALSFSTSQQRQFGLDSKRYFTEKLHVSLYLLRAMYLEILFKASIKS